MSQSPNLYLKCWYFVACGFLIGCAFGSFENVVYLIAGTKDITLRFFTSLIIHSCCSGLSAIYIWSFRQGKTKISCFILAILLHGLYNFFDSFRNIIYQVIC